MKRVCAIWLTVVLLGPATASHDWFGIDLCRSRPGRMPPALLLRDLPQPASSGAQLLARYCGQCHNLPHPGLHTAVQWQQVAANMFTLSELTAQIADRPDLLIPPPQEREVILAYLARHALRALAADVAAPGVYRDVCGDCHAVPAPDSYTAAQWPAVFARMAGYRTDMAREPLDALRATQVLAYLARQAAPATEDAVAPGRWAALAPVFALTVFGLWLLLTRTRRRSHRV